MILRLINKFVSRDIFNDSRWRKIRQSLFGLGILKIINLCISLLLVPLTLQYLGPLKYGVWLTLSSIVGWTVFFDFGLSNGMRNKLGEALAENNIELAKSIISTTFYILLFVSSFLYGTFWFVFPFLDWVKILNAPTQLSDINLLVISAYSFFILKFISGIIITILVTDQRPATAELINTIAASLSLLAIYLLTIFSEGSLLYVGLSMTAFAALIPLLASIWFFQKNYRNLRPSYKAFNLKEVNSLSSQGVQFFLIQVSGLVLFTTDNVIITHLFGPEEVVPYNISFKIFSYIILAYGVVMAPLWSVYTEAYYKNDSGWIEATLKKMLVIWLVFVSITIFLFFYSDDVYSMWVGDTIEVPKLLSLFMGTYVLLHTFNMIFVTFIFATSKLRMQTYISVFGAFINLPLSYIFAISLGFGSAGVILATVICGSINLVFGPIQSHRLLKNKATGIWVR